MHGKAFAAKHYRAIQALGFDGHDQYGRGAVLAIMVDRQISDIRYITLADVNGLPALPAEARITLTAQIKEYDPARQAILLFVAKDRGRAHFFATVLRDERTPAEKAADQIRRVAEAFLTATIGQRLTVRGGER